MPGPDRRATCLVQDGSAPRACPTAREPARRCRDVRVLECTLDDGAPHDCIWCGPPPRVTDPEPLGNHPIANAFAHTAGPGGRLADFYVAGSDDRAQNPTLTQVVDHEQAALETMRCAYAIDGVDGDGTAVRILVEGIGAPGSDRDVDAGTRTTETAGTDQRHGSIVLRHGRRSLSVLAHETGHVLTGRTGLGVFGDTTRQGLETQALSEGFSDINELVVAEGMRDSDPDVALVRASATNGTASRYLDTRSHFDARHFATSTNIHGSGYLAVAIYGSLAALVAGHPVWAPSGCADAVPPRPAIAAGARWWAQALQVMAARGNDPGFVDWCEATADTAPRWGVDRETVLRIFEGYGVPCGPDPEPEDPAGSANSLPPLPLACPVATGPADPRGSPGFGLSVVFATGCRI